METAAEENNKLNDVLTWTSICAESMTWQRRDFKTFKTKFKKQTRSIILTCFISISSILSLHLSPLLLLATISKSQILWKEGRHTKYLNYEELNKYLTKTQASIDK